MARAFPIIAGSCALLFSIFACLGCSEGVDRKTTDSYPKGCIVVKGARDVRFTPAEDEESPSTLVYRKRDDYPATGTIKIITEELNRMGWVPVDYLGDVAPPGASAISTDQWMDTGDTSRIYAQDEFPRQKFRVALWRGPKGELVKYQFSYTFAPGRQEPEKDLSVFIRHLTPAAATEALEADRKMSALLERWKKGELNEEEYAREMKALGAEVYSVPTPKNYPPPGAFGGSAASAEFDALEKALMDGKISFEEFKRKAEAYGVVVEETAEPLPDSGVVLGQGEWTPEEQALFRKLDKGEITLDEFNRRLQSVSTRSMTWGPVVTPGPAPTTEPPDRPPEYLELEEKWLNGLISNEEFYSRAKEMGVEVTPPRTGTATPAPSPDKN